LIERVVMSKRSWEVLAVSVPPELAREFEAIADAEGRNGGELFREMLRVYREYREVGQFEAVQRYGAAQARAVGVSSEEDVLRLIAEVRGA
jgi:metal-responsive CopG/Arc/MetJ family transcriptional regulator